MTRIPWNKGLTKETDERVRKQGEKSSITKKGNIPWNKGKKCPQISKMMTEVWKRPGRKERQHKATSGEKHYLYGLSPSQETIEKMKLSHSGENHWNYGQKWSNEPKEKMKNSHIGKIHKEETKNIISENSIKMWKNQELHINMSKRISKEGNPNWKGGITPLKEQIRSCNKYTEWRYIIFLRDNFTCKKCNDNSGGNLEAHHKDLFSDILHRNKITTLEQALSCTELWSLENGITLCEECHDKIPRKKNFFED